MAQLPSECIIDAFIETKGTKEKYFCIPVFSSDYYNKLYRNADLVIVAVEKNVEIIELMREKTGTLRNCFYMENDCTVACVADGRGWF